MLIARAGEILATVARHAVPLNGLFGRDWHPATALGVYWLDSALLVLVAALLCTPIARRTRRTRCRRRAQMAFFFGFFAGLKVLFDVWGRLARWFGWKSLKDREADAKRRRIATHRTIIQPASRRRCQTARGGR